MASLKSHLISQLLAIFLLSSLVNCNEEEDLLNSLNCHRAYLKLPAFIKNEEASCLAEEVVQKLEDQMCDKTYKSPYEPDKKQISQCYINVNHTKNGVILPVCVPGLELTVVFTIYTNTSFQKYINNSKYAQAGMSSEGHWMVLVLGTNTTDGDFASAANALVSAVRFGRRCLVPFFLWLFFFSVY